MATAQEVAHRLHKKLGSSPLLNFLLGGFVLLFWAGGSVVQVQTSEYLALGSHLRVAGVAWNVLLQPYLILSGQAPIQFVTAWLYGWIVEIVTLVFALALSQAVVKISTVNPHLGKGFIIFGALLIILNGWADYTSSPGDNWLVQILIAIAIGGIVTIGLPLGIGLIEHGFDEMGA